jgi:hypothetical protein
MPMPVTLVVVLPRGCVPPVTRSLKARFWMPELLCTPPLSDVPM